MSWPTKPQNYKHQKWSLKKNRLIKLNDIFLIDFSGMSMFEFLM